MSDTARTNAVARRDAALKEIVQHEERIGELRSELARIDEFLRLWAEFAGAPVDTVGIASPAPPATYADESARSRPKNPKKEDVAAAALRVIRDLGRPIQRDELYHRLLELGINIQGTNPEMVLSTMLWRMQERIVRIPKYGYWPRHERYDPAGYDPSRPYPGDDEHSDMVNRDLSGTLPDVDGNVEG